MRQNFVSVLSPESILPDIHICKEIYYKFFQLQILSSELNKYFIKNFIGG
jgi:hypothetical protein